MFHTAEAETFIPHFRYSHAGKWFVHKNSDADSRQFMRNEPKEDMPSSVCIYFITLVIKLYHYSDEI